MRRSLPLAAGSESEIAL